MMLRRITQALTLVSLASCGPAPDGTPLPGHDTADELRNARRAFEGHPTPTTSQDPRAAAARALLQAGRFDDAQQVLLGWAAEDQGGEPAFLLGWLHHERERYQLALPWLARALAAGPTYPRADQVFFLYGRCLQESGDLEAARAAYEADQHLFPDGGDAPFRLALLEFEEGRLDESERLLRAALERFERPQDRAKVHARLADVYCAREQLAEGRAALERCVELYPHYEAYYKLARLCDRLGDQEAAAGNLELHRVWRERARPPETQR